MPPAAKPAANAEAQSPLLSRRRWALLAAAGGAVAAGGLLGDGLAHSLARALPAAWLPASGALLGAAVAAVLVPLTGWAVLRIVAPTVPKSRSPAPVTTLRQVAKPVVDTAINIAPNTVPYSAAPGPFSNPASGSGAAPVDAQAPARDSLTGAYTQQHFVAAADREWSRIRRHGEDAALLMVDIDHFKHINDEQGMPCGDAMLVEITRLASATLRPYDLLARFGGGVLVVYLPHTDPLGALDVAERIRERVASLRLAWLGKTVKATVSVGVAGIGAAHGALDAVIADAGAALREAKTAGGNCVRSAPIPPKRNSEPARFAG